MSAIKNTGKNEWKITKSSSILRGKGFYKSSGAHKNPIETSAFLRCRLNIRVTNVISLLKSRHFHPALAKIHPSARSKFQSNLTKKKK